MDGVGFEPEAHQYGFDTQHLLDVGVSAMIPLINIIVFLKKGHKVRKIKKQQKNNSKLLGEEEEFEL